MKIRAYAVFGAPLKSGLWANLEGRYAIFEKKKDALTFVAGSDARVEKVTLEVGV